MRARLARIGTRSQPGNPVLEPLFRAVRANHPKADLALLERAYVTAERLHGAQMRKSGDPYITHPLAVTTILADIGMTEPTLVAALLHDTVEDTPYTLDGAARGLRRRGRAARRRRDQARQGQVRRLRAGRDHPQDDRRDVARHPGAGHQARRPAAQHAHAALRQARDPGAQGPRDARDLRAAGAPARHEHPQVGARGPRVRDPAPQDLRRDRPAGRRAGAVARPVPGPGDHPGRAGPQGRQDQGQGDRPTEALLLDLPEDDRRRPRVLRHLRPGRHPDPRRGRPRLLLRARRPALALEPGPRAVQGLRRDAEVQHVPVAAHDGDRPAGQAGRAADPDLRHAPPRRVRRRGALEVQGGRPRRRRHRPLRRPRRHDLGAPAARLAERGRGPGRVPGVAAVRDQPRRGLRLHPARRRDRAADRRDAGRLRVRRPHRGRPPHDRRAGQRPAGAAGVDARQRRRGRGLHLQGRQRRAVARLAELREVAAGPLQDPAVVHQGAARGGDRAGQGRRSPS